MTALWESVFQKEKEKLLNSTYRKGDKYSTIEDLAKLHGVSTTTSKRVLRKLCDENLIVSIPRAGSMIKRNLGPKKVYLLSYGSSIIHSEYMLGATRITTLNNIEVVPVSDSFLYESAEDNSVLLVIYDSSLGNCREIVKKSPHKIVFLGAPFAIPGAYVVRHNAENGSRMVVNHLVAKGHDRIAFLCSKGKWWSMGRFEGYMQALKENGLPFTLEYVREFKKQDPTIHYSEENRDCIYKAFAPLFELEEPPSAVFCYSDEIAYYVLEYCRDHNIKVPDEMAVCGYNNHSFANINNMPEPTSVEDYWQTVGETAMKVVNGILDGDDDIEEVTLVEGMLIEKSTT